MLFGKGWRLLGLPFVFMVCGCVGPTTPFGALDPMSNNQKQRKLASDSNTSLYKITFHPDRQVLHDRTDFSVEITGQLPLSEDSQLKVFHNGHDASQAFVENATLHKSNDGRTWIYTFKDLRFKTLDLNDIVVEFQGDGTRHISKKLQAPECSLFANRKLAHLGPFHAPDNYIDMIEKISNDFHSNPSFLAGIVAQESGFNPKAVSWAKAIGLTQMTPLAEAQVVDNLKDWPRYPGINELSYVTLKTKIGRGEINNAKEWRLDPEKSLRGGMTYVEYLKSYWTIDENKVLIESLPGHFQKNLTEVILASYNSGAARVKKAIQSDERKWKTHQSLTEAAKYIKKVQSYCYHYADREVSDDNET